MASRNSTQQDDFVVEAAVRDQALLRILFQAPSGGGKTTGALLLARGMEQALRARGLLPTHLNRFIGLIDTERKSSKKASHMANFDILPLEPPYSPARYMAAIRHMEAIGYPIIIIDQISHEWTGPGGVLDMVRHSKELNDFAKWNGPSQDHDEFIDAMLHCSAHLICTARSKTEYVLEEKEVNGRIKKVPVRIGMQARQREGVEYEYDTVLDLTAGSNAVRCIKDRCELFVVGETYPRLDVRSGERFVDWIYAAPQELDAAAGPSPAVRARALCDAAVRAVGEAPNLPDLVTVFTREQKALREFSREAGVAVMAPLIEELVAAKDRRKGEYVGDPNIRPAALVRDLDPAEAARPAKEPERPDAVAATGAIINKLQRKRDASGLFSEMPDDLPWQDDPGPTSIDGPPPSSRE